MAASAESATGDDANRRRPHLRNTGPVVDPDGMKIAARIGSQTGGIAAVLAGVFARLMRLGRNPSAWEPVCAAVQGCAEPHPVSVVVGIVAPVVPGDSND